MPPPPKRRALQDLEEGHFYVMEIVNLVSLPTSIYAYIFRESH